MINNSFDLGNGYVKFRSKIFDGSGSSEFADSGDLLQGESCLAISFTRLHRSMLSFVIGVFFTCSPYEVGKSVVEKVSIKMARFAIWWTRTTEGFEDKTMNGFIHWFAGSVYKYRTVISYLSGTVFSPNFPDFPMRKKLATWTRGATTHDDSRFAYAISRELRAMAKESFCWQRGKFRHNCFYIMVNHRLQIKMRGTII